MPIAAEQPRVIDFSRVLHPGQTAVRRSTARFKVVCCGRRWGKTRLGAALCVAEAVQGKRAWWVGPSYPIAAEGWMLIQRLVAQIPGFEINRSERLATFSNGGSVQVKSADNPDSLRGAGLDFLVIDEAAFTSEEAWSESLRPALSDRKGRAMFISTPNGFNWFHKAFCRADDDQAWQSWQLPTVTNPFIDPAEIEDARRDVSEVSFRQEYLAEFTAQEGRVFGDFSRSRHVKPCPIQEHLPLAIGVDFGYRTFGMVAAQVDKLDTLRIFADGEWKGLTTEQAIDRLKRLPWASRIEMIAVDPAGDSVNLHSGITDVKLFKAAFPNARVTFSYDPKHRDPEWRASRLRDRMWSAAGDCRLIVDPSCTATIRSLESSVYPPHKDGQQERKQPLKDGVTDHIRDALGYLEVNRFHRAKAQWVAR